MRRIVLIMAAIILLVPVTYIAAPRVMQWRQLHNLTSSDPGKQQRALRYLVVHVDKPGVFEGAMGAMRRAGEADFLRIVDALQSADRWRWPGVTGYQGTPGDVYLRWVGINAESDNVEAAILAAQRLAAMPTLADDPRLISILQKLTGKDSADVRYNALCAAAELYQSAKDPGPYRDVFARCMKDGDEVIARHASLFAYLVKMPGVGPAGWMDQLPPPTADRTFDQQQVRRLLVSPEPPLRDAGCVLAVHDLPPESLPGLIRDMLQDPRPEAKQSGAILSGLTGEAADLLRSTLESQSDWAQSRVLWLGLWMQGDPEADDVIDPAALLAQGDVPRSTILLAMLHRHDPLAYDVLLNPQGEAPGDLGTLLDDYGWWRVLNQYLPADAPRWRPTETPALQLHQIDLLRDWYLLNRRRLEEARE